MRLMIRSRTGLTIAAAVIIAALVFGFGRYTAPTVGAPVAAIDDHSAIGVVTVAESLLVFALDARNALDPNYETELVTLGLLEPIAREFATTGDADKVINTVGGPLHVLASTAIVSARPVVSTVVDYNPERARVKVWLAGFIASSANGRTATTWQTADLTAEWSDGRWLIVALTNSPGPIPGASQVAAAPARDIVGMFEEQS